MRAPLRLTGALLASLASPASFAEPPAPEPVQYSAVLVGFELGAALLTPAPDARFRVGLAIDWLAPSGVVLEARGYTTHTIDVGGSLALGAFGGGLVDGVGLPLGATLGPAVFWTRDGPVSVGAHASIIVSLWVARAALSLDVDWVRAFSAGQDRAIVSLVLRGVPWEPFRLSW